MPSSFDFLIFQLVATPAFLSERATHFPHSICLGVGRHLLLAIHIEVGKSGRAQVAQCKGGARAPNKHLEPTMLLVNRRLLLLRAMRSLLFVSIRAVRPIRGMRSRRAMRSPNNNDKHVHPAMRSINNNNSDEIAQQQR